MPFANARFDDDRNMAEQTESIDLEAMIPIDQSPSYAVGSDHPSRSHPKQVDEPSAITKFIGYPSQGSQKLRPTSRLDGVRGVAALAVYIFHAMGCWASIVPAWHSDDTQNNVL
ncbi:hypothetical protein G7Y89_g6502 [Cudoniella acicularis]|uniref:Acyltransferase 3 domain-containing protein n=1 Tax=Cudoniella acicularis TaxID=354080 RepID=A0A8H4RKE2_9HELO|nr:hypothetical protein G7Y89_g6502 [Cudoniella acicularis]